MIDHRKLLYLFSSFLTGFLCITVIGTSINSVSPRIIRGKNALKGKYPYMASLKLDDYHFCGGSILNERWILTAGHCLRGVEHYWRVGHRITVLVGTNRLSDYKGQEYDAEYMDFNEDWTDHYLSNDVGLVRVSKDIEFNSNVQKVKLPKEDFKKSNYPATMIGWGLRDRLSKKSPDNLQEITLNVIHQNECYRKYIYVVDINESHICTYTRFGEGICSSDPGSPLVADGVQIGIASFTAIPCATGTPDVYTRMYTFLDWIDAIQADYQLEKDKPPIKKNQITNKE